MKPPFTHSQIAVAALAAVCSAPLATAQTGSRVPILQAGRDVQTHAGPRDANRVPGKYAAGDFHNHSTCSDGSISMQKLVKKSTDKADTPWGLDWFVQAGHGGSGNRNCTLAEDASLATPAYPLVFSSTNPTLVLGPTTTWQNSNPAVTPKGDVSGTAPNRNMWRWQALQEYQYQITEYLNRFLDKPLFLGLESVVAGHEHSSMSVITGQIPLALDRTPLSTAPGYTAVGNANALAMWSYCFDRGVSDNSRGNTTPTSGVGNNWDCSVPGSLNSTNPSWSALAAKLVPLTGAGVGLRGHDKTVEAVKWLAAFHPNTSYYVPAHLERAGPFAPNGNNGFNVEHLRNFNNAGPTVAFGMETQPGHGASAERGEYRQNRNTIDGQPVDSLGGSTFGGTGVYGAQVGGVWDALLGEGRNFWFFASSDWHNRGIFGPDDRRSTLDYYPGEYQRNYTLVRNGNDPKLRPQTIVDGLRSGNTYVTAGQIIDRLGFVACASYAGPAARSNAQVEALALEAALNDTDVNVGGCATMGEKLQVRAGAEVVVAIVVRDPSGTNYSPYSFNNPSLAQIGISQPLDRPVLDHIDVIRGLVTGYRQPGAPDYAGAWPNNWRTNPDMAAVPAAAKNTSAALLRTFNASSWTPVPGNTDFKRMSFRIPALSASQYLRLRGTNLPPSTPFETDSDGNPLADLFTNAFGTSATDLANLRIRCNVVGSNVPANNVLFTGTKVDGCPNHLVTVNGQRYSSYDVAAWADLWFYGNPIFVEVTGSTVVAGVR